MSGGSGSESDSQSEARSLRPKTRAAVLSFADEDIDQITEALKDRGKGLKKWHAKLKSDYDAPEEYDSDMDMKEPKIDEDSERGKAEAAEREEQEGGDHHDPKPPPKRRPRRGKGKGRSISTIIRMRRTRFRNKLPGNTPPKPEPIPQTELEFEDTLFMIGDIVKLIIEPKKEKGPNSSHYYTHAQIRGFYRDQFCGKYAALQWLIPQRSLHTAEANNMDVFDPATFVQGQPHGEAVSLDQLVFVMRLPPWCTAAKSHANVQRVLRGKDGKREYMDPVDTPISSIDHTWFQIIY